MVARPLASGLPGDSTRESRLFLAFNFLTNEMFKLTQYLVVVRLVQRLWDDARANSILRTMYAGPSLERIACPAVIKEQRPLEHPLRSANDIDISRVEAVASMNSFGLQDITSQRFNDLGVGDDDRGTALYELPSFCNHSCIPSANRVMVGDIMIVRAARNLKAGSEITLCYVPADLPFAERAERLKAKWKFTCDCILCRADLNDGPAKRQERIQSLEKVKALALTETSKQEVLPRQRNVRVKEIFEAMNKTYNNRNDGRNCPIKPDLFVAACMLSNVAVDAFVASSLKAEQFITTEMETLECAGLVVHDKGIRGHSREMPLNRKRSYCVVQYCHRCIEGCIAIARGMHDLGNPTRAEAWVAAAKWSEYRPTSSNCILLMTVLVFGMNVADDPKLFAHRYRDLLHRAGLESLCFV